MFTPTNKPDLDKERIDRLVAQQAESFLHHARSTDAAVKIPALQGLLVALPVTGLVALAWLGFGLPRPELAIPGAGLLVYTVYVWLGMVDWRDMIWALESSLQRDLTGDHEIDRPAEENKNKGDRIDRVARLILERYYLDRQSVTRDACEDARLCTQPEWNTVNEILQIIGVKGKRDFEIADYHVALDLYRQKVSVFDDAILVRHGGGNGARRIAL